MAPRQRAPARKKDSYCPKGCGRVVCIVVILFLTAIAGGILLWQLLPEDQKKNVETIVDGGVVLPGSNTGTAPPPSYIFNQCADQSNCCNGLENTCDLKVTDILYAGLHNAQSSVQDGFFIAPNHQYNLLSALEYGYRVINLDIGMCNGVLSLVHGICKLGTTDPSETFQGIMNWLTKNPTEIVLIPIQIDSNAGGSDEPAIQLAQIYNMLNRIDGFTNRMYQRESGSDWPTLREMIEQDKRIFLFHYNGPEECVSDDVNCPPGFHDWWQFAGETKFEFADGDDFEDKTEACTITRGRMIAPFYALNLFTTIPSKQLAIDLLNTQSFLEEHIAACSEVSSGQEVNILFVDFWEEGNVPRVVQTHNRQLVASTTEEEEGDGSDGGRRLQTKRFLRHYFVANSNK